MTEKPQTDMTTIAAGDPGPVGAESDQPMLLVVDDDLDILRVVRFYLTKQNYLVHTATGGEEALDILNREDGIELILSDVMMPGMNGLELLKTVRENEKLSDIPLILISAEGETSKKVIGLNLGADDFITKPFNFDELMARVKNHIRLRRLQQEVLIASRQVLIVNEMLQKQNDRLLEDLEAARGVQMALMPDSFPKHPKFRLGSRYLPAERLGGDFFDVVSLDEGRKLGVLVADVCGHGVTAAFITAMTKITFQNACYTSFDPAVVLERMNNELFGNLKSGYVTVFYGIFNLENGTFTYASGGHPPLLVHRRAKDEIIELMPQATFLGFFHPVEFTTDSIDLTPGDRVIYYTDGLFESHGSGDEDFGIERVIRIVKEHKEEEIQPVLDRLIDALIAFMDGYVIEDDITLVAIDLLK